MGKRKGVNPEYRLDESLIENSNSEDQFRKSPSPSTRPAKRQRLATSTNLVSVLERMEEQRAVQHSEFMSSLKTLEQSREEKLKLMKEKNAILRQTLDVMTEILKK